MRKVQVLLLSLFISFSISAQDIWLEASLKGGYGLSFLLNKNISDDASYKYQLTTAYGVGGRFAVNFGPFNGISVEAMYNKLGQDFTYNVGATPGVDFSNKLEWSTVDAYLLYRYIRNRIYVELGPMYSFVQSVDQSDAGVPLSQPELLYEENYFSGVFGWGGYVAGSNTFSLGIGMRLHYSFSDFVNSDGEKAGAPNIVRDEIYDSYESSNPAFVLFMVELNFGIGRFAKTACHERMKFFRR